MNATRIDDEKPPDRFVLDSFALLAYPEAAHIALAIVDQLPIALVDVDRTLTLGAAHVKAHHTVSYADAFTIALARCYGAQVVTGDLEFDKVRHLVSVRWLERC